MCLCACVCAFVLCACFNIVFKIYALHNTAAHFQSHIAVPIANCQARAFNSSLKTPSLLESSWNPPSCTMSPASMTKFNTRSALLIVVRRCATMSTVRLPTAACRCKFSITRASVALSSALVASSSTISLAAFCKQRQNITGTLGRLQPIHVTDTHDSA